MTGRVSGGWFVMDTHLEPEERLLLAILRRAVLDRQWIWLYETGYLYVDLIGIDPTRFREKVKTLWQTNNTWQ